jgi:murein DD-endopeptidase MepM/ murein hydrolase activator NlpD
MSQMIQLPPEELITAFAVHDNGRELLLAGKDRLYFFNQPQILAMIPGGVPLELLQPHDVSFLESLNEFTVPIGGSNITFRDFQLPGAPRHYRLGVHHGLDFYWQPGTKVLAAGDGRVVRADLDYVPPTAVQLNAWWQVTQEKGYTPTEVLDDYLGRQVWIEHENGLVSRYAHLQAIAPGISEGSAVDRGQVIGEVGNSGSPASLESEKADAHLHFELWLGDHYLGQYLRPIEAREWIERIFVNR